MTRSGVMKRDLENIYEVRDSNLIATNFVPKLHLQHLILIGYL